MDRNFLIGVLERERDEIIYTLSQGEGSMLTYAETIKTISGTSPNNARTIDIEIVTRLKNGIDYILYLLKKNEFKLNKNLLTTINAIVAHDNYDNPGNFRNNTVRIGGSKLKVKVGEELYKQYEDIMLKYEKEKDPIKLMIELSKAQLFGNGNKRTAQLIMCGLLVEKGEIPFVVDFRHDVELIDALLIYYDTDDMIPIYELLKEKQKEVEKYYIISK